MDKADANNRFARGRRLADELWGQDQTKLDPFDTRKLKKKVMGAPPLPTKAEKDSDEFRFTPQVSREEELIDGMTLSEFVQYKTGVWPSKRVKEVKRKMAKNKNDLLFKQKKKELSKYLVQHRAEYNLALEDLEDSKKHLKRVMKKGGRPVDQLIATKDLVRKKAFLDQAQAQFVSTSNNYDRLDQWHRNERDDEVATVMTEVSVALNKNYKTMPARDVANDMEHVTDALDRAQDEYKDKNHLNVNLANRFERGGAVSNTEINIDPELQQILADCGVLADPYAAQDGRLDMLPRAPPDLIEMLDEDDDDLPPSNDNFVPKEDHPKSLLPS